MRLPYVVLLLVLVELVPVPAGGLLSQRVGQVPQRGVGHAALHVLFQGVVDELVLLLFAALEERGEGVSQTSNEVD